MPYAVLLWAPIYKSYPAQRLYAFVDWLGGEWNTFVNEKVGPFDGSAKADDINWDRAYVVTSARRVERYERDD